MEMIDGNLSKLVKVVCPSIEELSVIVNDVKCVQCDVVFKNEPRRRLHELKVHQRKNLDRTVKESIRFHCPERTCIYSTNSSRHFTTMKYLKQHYLKVHAAKVHCCTQCDKSFSTKSAQIAHTRVCGVKFICSCLKNYNSYEALLTHAKRQLHNISDKYKNVSKSNSKKTLAQTVNVNVSDKKTPIFILPCNKTTEITSIERKITITTRDIAIQTDDLKKLKKIRDVCISKTSRRESRQTQTNIFSKEKVTRKTVSTQTTFSHIKIRKSGKQRRVSVTKKDFSINYEYSDDNIFPNSPLQLNTDDLSTVNDFWEERSSSATQTIPEKNYLDVFNDSVTQTELTPFLYTNSSISRSDPMLTEKTFNDRYSSIETQTERPWLESIFDPDYACPSQSRTFALSSNIQTQTTQEFDNIEHLLYNNTCTQTGNDIFTNDLGFSDTQTQTAWPILTGEKLDSSESEHQHGDDKSEMSMMGCRSWLNIQTNHMETQTDLLSIFNDF